MVEKQKEEDDKILIMKFSSNDLLTGMPAGIGSGRSTRIFSYDGNSPKNYLNKNSRANLQTQGGLRKSAHHGDLENLNSQNSTKLARLSCMISENQSQHTRQISKKYLKKSHIGFITTIKNDNPTEPDTSSIERNKFTSMAEKQQILDTQASIVAGKGSIPLETTQQLDEEFNESSLLQVSSQKKDELFLPQLKNFSLNQKVYNQTLRGSQRSSAVENLIQNSTITSSVYAPNMSTYKTIMSNPNINNNNQRNMKSSNQQFRTPRQKQLHALNNIVKMQQHVCNKPQGQKNMKNVDDSFLGAIAEKRRTAIQQNHNKLAHGSECFNSQVLTMGVSKDSLQKISKVSHCCAESMTTVRTDPVTGLREEKYYLNDYEDVLEVIENLKALRMDDNKLGAYIDRFIEELGIQDIDQVKTDITRYIEKKQKTNKRRQDNTKNVSIFDSNVCKVEQLKNNFIDSCKYSYNYKDLNMMSLGNMDDHQNCSHDESKEDIIFQQLDDYKMFMKFCQNLQVLKKKNANLSVHQSEQSSVQEIDGIFDRGNEQGLSMRRFQAKNFYRDIQMSKKSTDIAVEISKLIQTEKIQDQQFGKDANAVDLTPQELRMKIAVRLLAQNNTQAGNRRKNHHDINELIRENIFKEKTIIDMDPQSNENMKRQIALDIKELLNKKVLFAIKVSKQQIWQRYEKYLNYKPNYVLRDPEDDFTNFRKNELDRYDEKIYFRANDFIDNAERLIKKRVENHGLLVKKKPKQRGDHDFSEENRDCMLQNTGTEKQGLFRMTMNQNENNKSSEPHLKLFKGYETTDQFYEHTKNIHNPCSQTKYFLYCQKENLLASPILFKCIDENKLVLQGKQIKGHVDALKDVLLNNKDPSLHILSLKLSENNMKDQEFAKILEGIIQNQEFNLTIQEIEYKNNELGQFSIEQLCLLLQDFSLKVITFEGCQIRRLQDLKALTQSIENNTSLQIVNFKDISLNDHRVVQNIYDLIDLSSSLTSLCLDNCNLLGKQTVEIINKLSQNPEIKKLDISNNCQSNWEMEIVYALSRFIETNNSLVYLNISNMQLKRPVLYLMRLITDKNTTLEYLDMSGNLLSSIDQQYIRRELAIDHQKPKMSEDFDLLMKTDQYFSRTFTKYAKNLVVEQKLQDDENFDEGDKVYNHMVNQAILKTMKQTTIGDGMKERIVLKRNCQNAWESYREIGQDELNEDHFDKSFLWQDSRSYSIEHYQGEQLMVFFHQKGLFDAYQEVTAKNEIGLLRKRYFLDEYHKNIQGKPEEQIPLIFGSITEWKLLQMNKVYKFCTAFNSHKTQQERKTLTDYVFDELNTDLKKDFKTVYGSCIPVLKSFINLNQTQIEGLGQNPLHYLGSINEIPTLKEDFLLKSCYVYTKRIRSPGSKTIFIYNPVEDKIYKRKIIVRIDKLKHYDTQIEKGQYEHKTMKSLPHTQFEKLLKSCFINDIGQIQWRDFTSDPKFMDEIFPVLEKNYQSIVELYYEMYSESDSLEHPMITLKYLKGFCDRTQIFDSNEIDEKMFEFLNRPKLLKFFVWVFFQKHHGHKSMDQYFEDILKVFQLERSNYLKIKKDIQNMDIHAFLDKQSFAIHTYLDKHGRIYGYSPKVALSTICGLLPISKFNLVKFYKLSVGLVVEENEISYHPDYLNLTFDQFVEFIYRIATYIWEPENYEAIAQEGAKEAKNPLKEESTYDKFIETMRIVVGFTDQDEAVLAAMEPHARYLNEFKQ